MTSRLCAAAGLAILLGVAPAAGQVTFVPDQTPSVSVEGHGSITERPDTAVVAFGIYGLNQDLRTAKSAVDAAVARMIKLADTLGMDRKDISSTLLNVTPHYSEDTNHKFLGYEVTRSVDVTLRDLTKLDELTDGAVQAGANRDFNISLKLSNAAALRERAVALAVEDAKAQGLRMASAFGMRLGPVRSISPGSRGVSSATGSIYSRGLGEGTFLPSGITITADVSVRFVLVP
jgi:uncharacterized protein YggE